MSEQKTLHLILKNQWFDMIASGVKKQEYRAITDHWISRLMHFDWVTIMGISYFKKWDEFKNFDTVTFQHGYGTNAPRVVLEFKGIEIGKGKTEWGAPKEDVFIIKLGNIITSPKK